MAFGKPIPIHPLGFAPDLPTSTPGVLVDANFMFPTVSGMRVSPSLVAISNALSGPCMGAFLSRLSGGGVNIFAGTAQHLYRLLAGVATFSGNGTTYDQFASKYQTYGNLPALTYGDKSFQPAGPVITPGPTWIEVDGAQTFTSNNRWSFAQAGDDAIATNGVDPVQVYPFGGTQFQALGGNPPRARFVIAVDPGAGVSVVTLLFNLQTDSTGWVASGPGADTVWTLNVNDLSASGFLQATPGPITAAAPLRTFAVAFKRNSLYLGAFVGPPFVWNFQPISLQIGCQSNDAIVNYQDVLCFPGPDDFYQFDGYNVTAIPNALKEWFFGTPPNFTDGIADPRYMGAIQGRYDTANRVIYWHFASVNAQPAGTLDTYVCWNPTSGRWGVGHQLIESAMNPQYSNAGMTYDQFCNLYKQYQNLPHLAYGDASFQPNGLGVQAVILTDHILYGFTGPPNSGYLQLGDVGDPERLTRIQRMRGHFGVFPAVGASGARAFMNTFSRQALGAPLIARKTGLPLSDRGFFDFIQADYWHQFQITFANDAEFQAYAIDAQDAGAR